MSISPFSEQIEELWVVCSLYQGKWSYTIGGHIVTRKTHEEISWIKSIVSPEKNKQKFKSSKSEYYKLTWAAVNPMAINSYNYKVLPSFWEFQH